MPAASDPPAAPRMIPVDPAPGRTQPDAPRPPGPVVAGPTEEVTPRPVPQPMGPPMVPSVVPSMVVEDVDDPIVVVLPPSLVAYNGGGGAVSYPPLTDLAVSSAGVYLLDTSGCVRPRELDFLEAGDCAEPSFRLEQGANARSRLVSDGSGGFYVASVQGDASASVLLFGDAAGNVFTSSAVFDFENGIGLDTSTRDGALQVYVLDQSPGTTDYRVQVFDAGLELVRSIAVAPALSLTNPNGLALDASGNIYLLSTSVPHVARLTNAGEVDAAFQLRGVAEGELSNPIDLAVDAAGLIFVADGGSGEAPRGSIRVFDASGLLVPSRFSTEPDFAFPELKSLALDASGALYVLDQTPFMGADGNRGESLFTFTKAPAGE